MLSPPDLAVTQASSPLPGWLRVRALAGEPLATALGARLGLWLHGAMTLYYAAQSWGGERAPLGNALSALALPSLLTATVFFRSTPTTSPFSELARQRGLSLGSLNMGVALARAWLVARPFAFSVPVLWLSALATSSALSAWFTALLGLLYSWLCALGLAACLSGLASLSERWSSARPGRVFWALVLIPALLKPALPELPSVWHGYRAWSQWVASHVEPV